KPGIFQEFRFKPWPPSKLSTKAARPISRQHYYTLKNPGSLVGFRLLAAILRRKGEMRLPLL
ncbi:MAG: hypothetical protein Q8N46_08365, partial [Anaerolineales bacterium]|nr:hypothetical protein [Anaerolineales bacterium]